MGKCKKPKHRKLLEIKLRSYPVYKKSITSIIHHTELDEDSFQLVFKKRVAVEQIEDALSILHEEEKEIIEAFYFDRRSVACFCEEKGMSERSFFRIKGRALDKMAQVLNLI